MTSKCKQPLGEFVAPFVLATQAGEISPRRLALLTAIGETGSISAAARSVGITYKAAWDAVDAMNNVAGVLLVQAQHGGRGGGGAELTPHGAKVVQDLACLQQLQAQFMAGISKDGDLENSMALLRRLYLKSSARNILHGTVRNVRPGGINAEVSIQLQGEDTLHAIVTQESAEDLELKPGREVHALIKASWIILVRAEDQVKTSARNRLCGKIQRIVSSGIHAELVIILPGGSAITAIITQQSLEDMQLQEGDAACALIKASHILLGVQA
jgi:molybdate transport system regulatory protein